MKSNKHIRDQYEIYKPIIGGRISDFSNLLIEEFCPLSDCEIYLKYGLYYYINQEPQLKYINRDTGFFMTKMFYLVFPKNSEILKFFHENRPKGVFVKTKYASDLEFCIKENEKFNKDFEHNMEREFNGGLNMTAHSPVDGNINIEERLKDDTAKGLKGYSEYLAKIRKDKIDKVLND